MTKQKFLVLFVFVGIIGLSLTGYAADVTGKWEFTMQTPRGDERVSVIKFVQDAEKLTVTMESRQGDEIEGQGTVKENKIEWKIVRSTPRGEFELVYKGSIEGNSMSGTVSFGDRGSMDWTAVKK